MKTRTSPEATPSIAREEWDFRPRPEKAKTDWTNGKPYDFLPDHEVSFCWEYELTRGSRDTAYDVEWRKGCPDPTDFDSLLAYYWQADPDGKRGYSLVWNWFYTIWPEYPKRPYLSVPPAERACRFKKTWSKEPKTRLPQVRILDLYQFAAAASKGEALEPIWRHRSAFAEMLDDVWVLRRHRKRDGELPAEIVAYEVDYSLRDDVLARRFKAWVVERRKQRQYHRLAQSGRSSAKRARAELVALGALRLRHAGLSITDAQEFTREVSGKPLYEDAGSWSDALKRAREALYQAN